MKRREWQDIVSEHPSRAREIREDWRSLVVNLPADCAAHSEQLRADLAAQREELIADLAAQRESLRAQLAEDRAIIRDGIRRRRGGAE